MEVIIYGSGALGRLALNILKRKGTLEVIGFVDDDPLAYEFEIEGLKIIGSGKDLPKLKRFGVEGVCIAIHDGETRLWTAKLAQGVGLELISAVHENASISSETSVGQGCIIDEGVRVEEGARIGNCCFLAAGSHVKRNAVVDPGTNVPAGKIVTVEEKKEEESVL